jgi:outer membrane protein
MNKSRMQNAEYRMQKSEVRIYIICLLFSVICLPVLNGCDEFKSQDDFLEVKVKPEQTREIKTLKLEEKKEPNEAIEVNKPAKGEVSLSIEQCRAMTLKNNLDLKVQLIEPSIAAKQLSAEEAKFESSFFTNANYTKVDNPPTIFERATQVKNQSVDMGVDFPLQTGGTVQFDLADNRTNNGSNDGNEVSYTPATTFSISQPLLRGAGKRVNTYSIRILEYQRQITDAMTKLEVMRVLANADRGYWRLYAARRLLEVRQQEYELAQAQLEQTRRMVLLGEKAAVEETRSEAGVAERLNGIITAKKAVEDRQRELKRIMNEAGLGVNSPAVVVPLTEPDPVRYEINKEQLTASAVENRMEMLEVELQIAQDSSTVDYYKNQTLPLVALNYTYSMNSNGPTRSDAYDMMFDGTFESHRVGMNLVVPLGNEAAKNQLLGAQYRKRQSLFTKDNRRIQIENEVLGAIDQIEANWQSILAGRQNSILAGRLYEAEKRQFVVGLRTATDVLDAQAKFANAQSTEILALTEYQIAQIDLAYATGTLLGAAKIQWQPIVPNGPGDNGAK